MGYATVEYVAEDGSSPFGAWFDELHVPAAVKVAGALRRLEAGYTSSVKWLGGGTKKGQQRDIERAWLAWADYKRRRTSRRPNPKSGG